MTGERNVTVFLKANITTALIAVAIVIIGGSIASPIAAQDAALLKLYHGADAPIELSLADLDRLPQHSFTTSTQWTEGKIKFSGPALKDVLGLLAPIDADEETVRLVAANYYEVELDQTLLELDVPIVSTRMNDETFGTREKGPLWVVFPYDADEAYRREGVYAASVWHLIEIQVEK